MTKQEIASELGSKPSYEKQEVVDLVFDVQELYEEKMRELEARLTSENEARFSAWKDAYESGLKSLREEAAAVGLENGLHWAAGGLVGIAAIVYGIVRGDPAVVGTGCLLAGSSLVRVLIYLR